MFTLSRKNIRKGVCIILSMIILIIGIIIFANWKISYDTQDFIFDNVTDLSLNKSSIKTKAREKLARVKVFADILIRKNPKFLGEQIDID